MFPFVILSLFDSMVEVRVPFFYIFLKEARRILISSCLGFHRSSTRSTCLVKLHCIWDSQTSSEDLIGKNWFGMRLILPLNNRFFNFKLLTLSLVSCSLNEEAAFGFSLLMVCSLASSLVIPASQSSIYCLLGSASPSLWSTQTLVWSFWLMGWELPLHWQEH